jgi:hypothetical protein
MMDWEYCNPCNGDDLTERHNRERDLRKLPLETALSGSCFLMSMRQNASKGLLGQGCVTKVVLKPGRNARTDRVIQSWAVKRGVHEY